MKSVRKALCLREYHRNEVVRVKSEQRLNGFALILSETRRAVTWLDLLVQLPGACSRAASLAWTQTPTTKFRSCCKHTLRGCRNLIKKLVSLISSSYIGITNLINPNLALCKLFYFNQFINNKSQPFRYLCCIR